MKNYKQILEAINKGIKFALDDIEDSELQGQVNSKVKYQGGTKEWLDLIKEVIDLGLPSGTLWCKYNLGATCEPNNNKSWYGDYYAWGELEGNKIDKDGNTLFYWNNYKFGKDFYKLIKYCHDPNYGLNGFTDNLTVLLPEDDVAYQTKKLHNYKFHIPTKEQCEELMKYTKNYFVKNYDPNKLIHNPEDDRGIQGLNGRVFEGKNKNQLFIPAAGFYIGSDIYGIGFNCRLWSLNLYLDEPSRAYHLNFNSDIITIARHYRDLGYSVRPVINL